LERLLKLAQFLRSIRVVSFSKNNDNDRTANPLEDYMTYSPVAPTFAQLQAMTEQDMFDHSARAILVQGHPATAPEGSCVYRNASGSRCALGWLIPDEFIDACEDVFAGSNGLIQLLEVSPDTQDLAQVLRNHRGFLLELQTAHDSGSRTETIPVWRVEVRARLERLALVQGLSTAVLDVTE
jgi:hypothetical protein